MKIDFTVEGEFIKLDSLIKVVGLADTGGHAKQIILDEVVRLNGEVVTQRGKKIRRGDVITIDADEKITIKVI